MNKKELEDLAGFSQVLGKITVEAALNAELDDQLSYEKVTQRNQKIHAMVIDPKP